MPTVSKSTAQMLGSVAQRYRPVLSSGGRVPWERRSGPLSRASTATSGSTSHAHPRTHALGRDKILARVEAVLFLAKEPLSSRKLAQLARLADGTEGRTLVRRLNRLYDLGGSPFRVDEVAGGFQLLTRPKFSAWLRRLYPSPVMSLSAPALETLAVVAYRQPVIRAEIESIRGVQCDEILRHLMDRDLLKIVGRAEDLGRPMLYGTTRRFLQVFGLRHVDDLPRANLLRSTTSEPGVSPTKNSPLIPPAISLDKNSSGKK